MDHAPANRWFVSSLLAFLALSAVAGAGMTLGFDRAALALAQSRTHPALDAVGDAFSVAGDVEHTGPAFLAFAAGMFWSGRRRVAWRLLAAFVATGVVEVAMKFLLPVPSVPTETARSVDPHPIVDIAYPYPYPSGHSLRWTILAGAIFVLWPNRTARALLAASLAGMVATRLYLGVHWASDVVGGVLLGVAGLAWAFREKGKAGWR